MGFEPFFVILFALVRSFSNGVAVRWYRNDECVSGKSQLDWVD